MALIDGALHPLSPYQRDQLSLYEEQLQDQLPATPERNPSNQQFQSRIWINSQDMMSWANLTQTAIVHYVRRTPSHQLRSETVQVILDVSMIDHLQKLYQVNRLFLTITNDTTMKLIHHFEHVLNLTTPPVHSSVDPVLFTEQLLHLVCLLSTLDVPSSEVHDLIDITKALDSLSNIYTMAGTAPHSWSRIVTNIIEWLTHHLCCDSRFIQASDKLRGVSPGHSYTIFWPLSVSRYFEEVIKRFNNQHHFNAPLPIRTYSSRALSSKSPSSFLLAS